MREARKEVLFRLSEHRSDVVSGEGVLLKCLLRVLCLGESGSLHF